MKRTTLLLVLVLLCGIRVAAQRPVGDTLAFYDNTGDYWYSSIYQNTAYWFGSWNISYFLNFIDYDLVRYKNMIAPDRGQMSWDDYIHLYPDFASSNLGRHISGQEYAIHGDMVIIGLAVCPRVLSTAEELSHLYCFPYAGLITDSYSWIHAVDTTTSGRLTEYVQLYTIEGGQPMLRGEGEWRIEYPHRFLNFPNTIEWDSLSSLWSSIHHEPYVVPLYEAMFDTAVYIEDNKSSIMVAGTHNNNGAVWSTVACDEVFYTPRICYEHSLTTYTTSKDTNLYDVNSSYGVVRNWVKYDTLPWYCFGDRNLPLIPMNIFPILDTMFGKPCAAVSNLQAVEVDTLWATVMWSADARHHYWEVEYCATRLPSDSARVVTVEVPTVTLSGLEPGTEYSVVVRGQCDIYYDNYSPWGDTLLFTTPQDTTPDTFFTLGAHGMGNLDRFTRVVPNPAREMASVLSSYRLKSVAMYDLTGRLVLEQPAEGLSAVVNVSTLPRGTYIVAIHTQQGVATKKLVVE